MDTMFSATKGALVPGLVIGATVMDPERNRLPSETTRVSYPEVAGPDHRLESMLMAGLSEPRLLDPE